MSLSFASSIMAMVHDWRLVYTPKVLQRDLNLDFIGPGWYLKKEGAYLIVPMDRKFEDSLKKEFVNNERFEVFFYSQRDPRNVIESILNADVCFEEKESVIQKQV